MSREIDEAFEQFVRSRSTHLIKLALLLTGQNRVEAEDLLQIALERAYRRRNSLHRDRSPEPYVRRVIANCAIDRHRWRRRTREQPLALADEVATPGDWTSVIADRDGLIRSLSRLPPRQRAVLVLRYWEDMTDAAIAETLGCSLGTVKSQLSRGLARLREEAQVPADGKAPQR